MITLRQNQIEPVAKGIKFFQEKKPLPSIIVAPTAAGKSIMIAKIAEAITDKLLILQPSLELLTQNYSKYTLLGGKASIYSASAGQKKISDTTYATIGSIASIGKTFKEMGFTKMIIDESDRYPRSDGQLGRFLTDSGITHVLGLTATPLKLQTNTDLEGNNFSKLVMLTSQSKKGTFFKEIIHVTQVSEMVDLGFWSKLIYELHETDDGQLKFNSTKADYTEQSMKAVYQSNNVNAKIVQKIAQIPERKSIIVFVPSVAEAIKLSSQIPNSIAVYGDMGAKERDHAVSFFKKGIIRTVINVNVLSVGFDHPELDTIICARPTASLSWFYQALGRGTRIHPNKKDCLIVDFSGNVKKFGPVEKLVFVKENIWKLYGENGVLLTGVPLNRLGEFTQETESIRLNQKAITDAQPKKVVFKFGKYQGQEVQEVHKTNSGYLNWMLNTFEWNKYNSDIKKEIERLNTV